MTGNTQLFTRLALKKSTQVSFTCPQCNHLQRNGNLNYNDTKSGQSGGCTCDHCGFTPFRFGHQDTFISIASGGTDLDMADYYRDKSRTQRDRKDHRFAPSRRRVAPLDEESYTSESSRPQTGDHHSVPSPTGTGSLQVQGDPSDNSVSQRTADHNTEAQTNRHPDGISPVPSTNQRTQHTPLHKKAFGLLKKLIPSHDRQSSRSVNRKRHTVDARKPGGTSRWQDIFRHNRHRRNISSPTMEQEQAPHTPNAPPTVDDPVAAAEKALQERRRVRTNAARRRNTSFGRLHDRGTPRQTRSFGDMTEILRGVGGGRGSSSSEPWPSSMRNSDFTSTSDPNRDSHSILPIYPLPVPPFLSEERRRSSGSSGTYMNSSSVYRGSSRGRGRGPHGGSGAPTRSTSVESPP